MTDTQILDSENAPSIGVSVVENLWRRLLLLGTPILLGGLFVIHPDGSGGLNTLLPVAETWLFVHVAMLPLLGLWGVSFYVLLDGYTGPVATVGRIGVAIYMTFYLPFEAIAGITTGLLSHEAHGLPPAQQEGIATAIDTLLVPSLVLGIIGTLGVLIAVVAIGILLRRSGAPLAPLLLLGGAPLAAMFHGGTPIDALALTTFLVGVVWLEFRWWSNTENQIRKIQQSG